MTDSRKHGLRIAAWPSAEPTPEELAFINQLGIKDVVLWLDGAKATYDYCLQRKKIFAEAGIDIYSMGNTAVHCSDSIVLNLPDRDEKIDKYKQHIRILGKLGIPYMTHAQIGNGVWCSDDSETRGGAMTRTLDLNGDCCGRSGSNPFRGPLSHGRIYSVNEIWDNYEYFVRRIAPVAEEANVKIGVHPDDPPVAELAGVPRCFYSFDTYKRALEIADSPNIGMCLCVGCWLEGGESMGKDVFETIRYFAGIGKLFKVHFRNVDRPLPNFVETFIDDGYMDMYEVMKVLREVNFDGPIIADHVPRMVGGPWTGTAFTTGYMKALAERAEAEISSAAR